MVLCCKCGDYGYIRKGTVDSVYRPKFRRGYVDTVYVVKDNKKIVYGRYRKRYIRHPYSSAKYQKLMERYRNHEIKWRPNGQRRCYLSPKTMYSPDGIAFCHYRYPSDYFGQRPPKDSMEKLWRGPTNF